MDIAEYNRRMKLIHDELSAIAERTEDPAWVKSANYSNPQFVALMRRHSELTRLSSELTNWMMDQIGA